MFIHCSGEDTTPRTVIATVLPSYYVFDNRQLLINGKIKYLLIAPLLNELISKRLKRSFPQIEMIPALSFLNAGLS